MAIVNIGTKSDADFFQAFRYQMSSGTPIDLTDNTLRMGVRRRAEDVAEVLLMTTENGGIIITDAPNGAFSLLIRQDSLVRLAPDQYVHSLIRTRPDDLKLPVWEGTLTHEVGPSR